MIYIITGGEFNNKGAEAMTLRTIAHIKKSDKHAMIIILTGKRLPPEYRLESIALLNTDKHVCDFLLNFSVISLIKSYANNFLRFIKMLSSLQEQQKSIRYTRPLFLYRSFKAASFMIDVSGYAISSKFPVSRSESLLKYIEIAHKYACKIILMPQSFGPLNFEDSYIKYIKKTLSLCDVIYAREKDGFDLLNQLNLTNVMLHKDMVLCDNDESIKSSLLSFSSDNDDQLSYLNEINSLKVAIIPNCRLTDSTLLSRTQVLSLYRTVIHILLNYSAHICIIPHAYEDVSFSEQIYEMFSNNPDITLIHKVMPSIHFQECLSMFDFVIASRYHSIVHAYKSLTPAIIIGWADKYPELAKLFNQTDYLINISPDLSSEEIDSKIHNIISKLDSEEYAIQSIMAQLQSNDPDCFSFLSK